MTKLPSDRGSIRLSWSDAVAGAELYEGENVNTFATDWHFHEGWQLVAVTSGKRHYEFKTGSVIARPGRLVLLPPRSVHRAHCLEGGSTTFRIATLPAVSGKVATPGMRTVRSASKPFDTFIALFESLKFDGKNGLQTADLSSLQAILRESSIRASRVSTAPAFVLQTEAYLLKALDKVPSLDLLSSLSGVSRYHLSHAFTKHVGLAPLAFHTRARLMRSRRLIAEGASLADTSFLLSFADQSHFGRQFKSVYAMTPGEYQQSLEND